MAPDMTALKILLIGSAAVGKSSLLIRFTDDEFLPEEEASATIGVDYKTKFVTVDDQRFKLCVWDTAGQERYRTLTHTYYRSAHGVILVYDVTDRASFLALPTWFRELETFSTNTTAVRIVVGNKVDEESARAVSTSEGKAFAANNNCAFLETSAKWGENVQGAFEQLVRQIVAQGQSQRRDQDNSSADRTGAGVSGGLHEPQASATIHLEDSQVGTGSNASTIQNLSGCSC